MTVLSLRGISKTFGAVAALTDIELDVAAGQVVAIVGDNGAGKSTLVKILSGVHPPDGGTITFEGREVDIPTPAAAHKLGIATVFQDLRSARTSTSSRTCSSARRSAPCG